MKKIFSPDLMFNDFIKTAWHKNIQTVDDNKVPIQQSLKLNGIYAAEIQPIKLDRDIYWALGFPLNKSWKNEAIPSNRTLYFDAVTSCSLTLTVQFQVGEDDTCVKHREKITIENIDDWKTQTCAIPKNFGDDLRLIIFSGPVSDMFILLKNIYMK
jgi:hypothetical protein